MSALKNLSIASFVTTIISFAAVAPVSAAAFYEVTPLDFVPSDINDKGEVVGDDYLWQAGKLTDLTTLPETSGGFLDARGINNKGEIVGNFFRSGSVGQPFKYDGERVTFLLEDYICNDDCFSSAYDINDAGTVVFGTLFNDGSGVRSYGLLESADGIVSDRLFPDALFVFPLALNNSNQVVTTAQFSNPPTIDNFGVLWDDGEQKILLPAGEPEPFFSSDAQDINDGGNVVGSSRFGNSPSVATFWESPETAVSLGTLGSETSVALGINNSKQIVGVSNLADNFTQHAFLWEDGELIDLNSLIESESGWELVLASEINNNGDIIGVGNFNGEQRGFVAKAVPEPSSTLGVLGLGVFGLVSWGKRRVKR